MRQIENRLLSHAVEREEETLEMELFQGFGRILVIAGLVLAGLGVLMLFAGKIPGVGRLPGDILIQRGNFTIYFPIVTMILLSVVLTIILNVVFRR